jgi:tetrahydromethanopterin S-methyltransferase subunit G
MDQSHRLDELERRIEDIEYQLEADPLHETGKEIAALRGRASAAFENIREIFHRLDQIEKRLSAEPPSAGPN